VGTAAAVCLPGTGLGGGSIGSSTVGCGAGGADSAGGERPSVGSGWSVAAGIRVAGAGVACTVSSARGASVAAGLAVARSRRLIAVAVRLAFAISAKLPVGLASCTIAIINRMNAAAMRAATVRVDVFLIALSFADTCTDAECSCPCMDRRSFSLFNWSIATLSFVNVRPRIASAGAHLTMMDLAGVNRYVPLA
jgi:hypothetical protein